jgi:acyl-CoA reductase-like NAD-dependent aldehyde dehydrogenase
MSEWKFGPALATGNCIVHKPSEKTPLTVMKFAELIKEAGFPPGVFNIVPGFGDTAGEALTRSTRVHKVSFTGSTLVGRRVMKASSETNLKKVTLELGGNSTIVVCPSANLEKTMECVWSIFM